MTTETGAAESFGTYAVEARPDLVYASADGVDLMLDLFLPRGCDGPVPAILWLHGGGWRRGDRKLAPDLKRYFAGSGFAMASIEYRLSQQATFPAPIRDTWAAIRWLKAHADEYGIDPDRIGTWGSSAGGYLATMTALPGAAVLDDAGSDAGSAAVKAVVNGYAPVDFLKMDGQRDPSAKPSDDPESIQLPEGTKSTDPDSFESLFLGAPITTIPDRVREASPVTYVTAGAAPMLILHGTSDTLVPWRQSEMLYDALAEAGNEVTLALIDKLGHGFFNREDFTGDPPRRVAWRTAENGRQEAVADGPPVSYATVLDFFRRRLAGA